MSTLGGVAPQDSGKKIDDSSKSASEAPVKAGSSLGGPAKPVGASLGGPPPAKAASTLGGPPAKGASLGGPPPKAASTLGGPPPKAASTLGGPVPAKAAGATLGTAPPVATEGAKEKEGAKDKEGEEEEGEEGGGGGGGEDKKKKKKKKKAAAAPADAKAGPAAPKDAKGAKEAKGAKAPKQSAIGKKLAEAMAKKRELEEQQQREEALEREKELAEAKRLEEEKAKAAQEEARLHAEKEEQRKKDKAEQKRKKEELERLEKLKAYGLVLKPGQSAKEEHDAKLAKEKAKKEAAEKKRKEEAEAARIKAEEEAKRIKEEEEKALAAQNAPLVDDWMTAADDWSSVNVEALAAKVPVDEEQERIKAAEEAAKLAASDSKEEAKQQQPISHHHQNNNNNNSNNNDAKEDKGKREEGDSNPDFFESSQQVGGGRDETLRSPICCVLGHVDVGKTKLLDYMRKTHVQSDEAGGITQQIGATFFPAANLEEAIQKVASRKKISLEVPGLLIIDTPGHESFANLRSRGSGLCDLAILVVDLVVGVEKQTIESIGLLKMRKTPFVIALNKLDRVYEWKSAAAGSCALNYKKQANNVVQDFQGLVNRVIVQFAEQGLNAELYWKNKDVKTCISMIPTSAHTGEGVPDLLMVITQITQRFLQERITFGNDLQATVLEVKPLEGLGTTIDVILVNGTLHRGDRMVLCGLNGAISTTIKTLLTPQAMKELRVKTPYQQHEEIRAAQGLKILAPGHDLEKAVPGSPLIVVHTDEEERVARAAVMEEFEKLRAGVNKDGTGVYVQSSTLGALEALLHFLKQSNIPVCDFGIGAVSKTDVIKASCMHDRKLPEYACILAFDVKINADARLEAIKAKVKLFEADIIYHLEDNFKGYLEEIEEAKRAAAAEDAVFPCCLQVLPDHVFNTKDPIILGCRVLEGTLRPGTPICVPGRKNLRIGKVSKIEANHVERNKAVEGDEVAVSIESGGISVMYGRHFDHNDKLYSHISRRSINALKEFFAKELKPDDIKLLIKLKKIYDID